MSPEQFLQVADLLPDAALLVTGDGTVLAASRRVADRLGLAPDRLGGRPLADRAAGPPGGLADYLRACARSREPVPGTIVLRADDGREVACRAEGAALRPAGEAGPALLLLRLFPRDASVSRYLLLNQKIDELAREVRRRRHAEGLLTGQKRVLEGIARGEPLPDILDALARLVEGEYPGSLCSVLLLDGGRLRHGAAPNLPADYTRALDGLPIGPCAGSCGTAAYRGEPVVVADLAADPLWDGYRDLALRHGLRACWSVPVFSSVGRVLGTLAVYYRQPRRPAPGEAAFAAEVAAYLAGIAVERARTEEALRQRAEQLAEANRHKEELLASLRASEEQFRTLADSIPQLAWMARPDGYLFWYNRRWYEYTGTTPEQMAGWGWQSVHDPAELPRVLARWKAALASGEPWEDTFPLRRRDGELRWHLSRALPVRDDQGRVTRWFGTNTDITERMRMEAALREADRRKDLFLATLAHELRNPLAPIRNAVQILRLPGTDAAARAQALEMMERQLRHLVRLLDDLMDVSRI
ncbi:MAG TPA: PAS domain-containing protein, partial [Gemmataceae bacterium]|nr:PAS domain-containing protein [Gemmataceae bacterium]